MLRKPCFALTGLALAALTPLALAQTVTLGPNINVTRQAGSQSETAIAISRTNTNLVGNGQHV